MLFLSWNILAQRFYPGAAATAIPYSKRLEQIHRVIRTHNTSIVCLQEVNLESDDTDWKLSEYNYIKQVKNHDIGNIILWKSSDLQLISVKHSSCSVAAIFACRKGISDSLKLFQIINIHLRAGLVDGSGTRESQIRSILKKVVCGYNGNMPIIICGDFNDLLDEDETGIVPILLSDGFQIYRGAPSCYFPDFKYTPWDPLDHVAARGDIHVILHDTFIDVPIPNFDNPSDHLPLLFEI